MNAIRAKDPVCSSRSVMLFADGELDASHAVEVESHLRACCDCREELVTIRAIRCSLRRSTPRGAPAEVEQRITARLTEALSPLWLSDPSVPVRSVPAAGAASTAKATRVVVRLAFIAAAACFVLVVVSFGSESFRAARSSGSPMKVGQSTPLDDAAASGALPQIAGASLSGRSGATANENGLTFDALLDQLVALHANPLPPDTKNPDELTKFEPWVGVPVKRSAITVLRTVGRDSVGRASFDGARIHPMRDARGAAALQYKLQGHRLTVYVFDPRMIQMARTRLRHQLVQQSPVYVGQMRGFSVAAAEREGIGYAVASDLDEDKSIQMVASF